MRLKGAGDRPRPASWDSRQTWRAPDGGIQAHTRQRLQNRGGRQAAFDGAAFEALGDMADTFWPLMVRTLILLLLIIKGEQQATIPVAGGVSLLQARQSGMFG